jgi:hypothetical protein
MLTSVFSTLKIEIFNIFNKYFFRQNYKKVLPRKLASFFKICPTNFTHILKINKISNIENETKK